MSSGATAGAGRSHERAAHVPSVAPPRRLTRSIRWPPRRNDGRPRDKTSIRVIVGDVHGVLAGTRELLDLVEARIRRHPGGWG